MTVKHVNISALTAVVALTISFQQPANSAPGMEAFAPAAAVASAKVNKNDIANYGVVTPTISRGAQPSLKGFKWLKDVGVKTIVNLRDGDDDIENERQIVESLGLKYVSIPMSAFKKMTNAHVDKFLAVAKNSENEPVFVHCRQGRDRTGAILAAYRVKEQSWSVDKAYDEMLEFGFHTIFIGLSKSFFNLVADNGSSKG